MKLSIRTRLTLSYCSIVVAVLVTGAVVGSFAQYELSLQRLDDDLARSMATLEGVMRTEFNEGLTLEAAAEEASIEVVVPDRTLMLTRIDGTVLEVWGLHIDPTVPARDWEESRKRDDRSPRQVSCGSWAARSIMRATLCRRRHGASCSAARAAQRDDSRARPWSCHRADRRRRRWLADWPADAEAADQDGRRGAPRRTRRIRGSG